MRATKQISRSRYQIVKTAQLVLAMHKTHVKHLQPDAAGQIFNRLKSSRLSDSTLCQWKAPKHTPSHSHLEAFVLGLSLIQ